MSSDVPAYSTADSSGLSGGTFGTDYDKVSRAVGDPAEMSEQLSNRQIDAQRSILKTETMLEEIKTLLTDDKLAVGRSQSQTRSTSGSGANMNGSLRLAGGGKTRMSWSRP